MRLLIVSRKDRMTDYFDFVEALSRFGVEAICVENLKYCFLSEFKPLHVIPSPKLFDLMKQFNPDMVMTDHSLYVPYMAKLVNRRVFFHLTGDPWGESSIDRFTYPSLLSRVYTSYLDRIATSSIGKMDLLLPNCKWLQELVKQHLPNYPNHLLYDGISTTRWKPWEPDSEKTFSIKHPAIVGVFSFNIYAKILGLLKFMRVIKKMPELNFYFLGNGPYLSLIKRNCPPNMFLIGKVSSCEVQKMLQSCDLFVHPSGLDALPKSVKEASLMEKPIVASNVGGIPEIVRNNQTGYLCDVDNVDQWVHKIHLLLDNPEIGIKLGRNAREFVANTFDWRKIAKEFCEFSRLALTVL